MGSSGAGAGVYLDRPVRSSTGPILGRVYDVLADAYSRTPQWLVLRTAGPLPGYRAVPLQLVLDLDRGLVVPICARTLRRAPRIRRGHHLTAQEELVQRRYWMTH